ncbi:MAG: relaxase/mobilization nuclease domain-containing protein [Clostridia bacterium]|nr:relaxase/mobilization nuclease domain-containing protein [Clostridia bacterium]
MPLFKGLSSKSTPKKAIDYRTRKDKAAFVSVRNLFEDEDYAEQFADTMRRFGKGKKFDERKYYHFKLSCARKDNISPEQAHLYAQELAAILFPDDECVIATHTDTKTVHSHIIVNAVNPITGKKLRITESDYTKMKDEANRLGSEFGYTSTNFRKKAEHSRTAKERHIILKGCTSWKEELRMVIEIAKQSSSKQEEFISHLALYGISVTRSKTEYSYLHPQKKKAIRGLKLGSNYTKKEIENAYTENRHRRNGEAVEGLGRTGVRETERGIAPYDGQPTTQRNIDQIRQEMQRLDRKTEYAHRGLDYEREELRERERLEREQAERERIECSHRDEELARRNQEIQRQNFNRTKSNNKADGNYASK